MSIYFFREHSSKTAHTKKNIKCVRTREACGPSDRTLFFLFCFLPHSRLNAVCDILMPHAGLPFVCVLVCLCVFRECWTEGFCLRISPPCGRFLFFFFFACFPYGTVLCFLQSFGSCRLADEKRKAFAVVRGDTYPRHKRLLFFWENHAAAERREGVLLVARIEQTNSSFHDLDLSGQIYALSV